MSRKIPKKGSLQGVFTHQPLPRTKKCTSSIVFANRLWSMAYKMTTRLAHPKCCFFAPKRAFLCFVKHIFTIAKAYIYADYCIYFHSSSSIWWVKTRFFVFQNVSFKHHKSWFENFHGLFLSDYFVSCQMCLNFLLFVW